MATIFTNALGANDTGYESQTHRLVTPITGNALDQVRVQFEAHSAATFQCANCSIGIWNGTQSDTTATPVELLFSGLSGFTLTAGNTLWSDWANLTGFTSSNLLVVIMDVAASNGNVRIDTTVTGALWLAAAGASYNVADSSLTGPNLEWIVGFNAIETQSVAAAVRRKVALLGVG